MSPHYPIFNSTAKKLCLLVIGLLLLNFSSFAQTSLYSENFTYSNGTTSGSGNPAKWTLNNNGFTPTTFSVQTNQFQFTNTVGEVIWQSQVFSIAGWMSVSASLSLPASANMEVSDYLSVYYKINGGTETLFTTNGTNTGTYAARTASVSGLSGTTMQVIVRASNNAANENHYIDNLSVTGLNEIYNEPFTYADGTTTSALWTRNLNGNAPGTYSVLSNQMNVTFVSGGTGEIIWSSSVLTISSYAGVTARLDVNEVGGLEADDYIKIFYKLNGGAETAFSTNGSIFDDFGAAIASQSLVSGSTFQIVIRVKNNSTESHLWDNVIVTADNFAGALSGSTAGTNVTCNGGTNGAVNLTVTGGRSPYSFSWSNSATTEDLSNFAAGTYTVTVTDNRGTTATASQTLTQPSAYNFTKTLSNYNGVNVSCNGSTNGSVNLTVTGNTSPYTYIWSTGAITQNISGRTAGTYTVTVTDANGCTGSTSATLTQPAVLSTSETHVNVSCYAGNNGSIDLTPSGGTAAYSYSWSNGATTQDISGLTAASYSVTVTDVNGCTATRSVTVTQPVAALSGSISAADTICNGQKITIDLTVSGGTPAYTYVWSTGEATQDLTNRGGGTYTVTVTDSKGCTTTTSKTIVEPSAISLSLSVTDASLYGISDGAIDLTVSGGVPSYTYQWGTGVTTQDITSALPGWYPVTVTDAYGCTLGGVDEIGYTTPNDTILTGSFIINMGSATQTVGNGLKPYGMIYDLVKNYKVPIMWSINPTKVKDAKDFTYNGTDYKGGTFIIEEDWITATVATRISYWQGLGVVGTYTTSSFVAPIFQTFTGFTNVVLDEQNDGIVTPYFSNAGIPSSFWSVGLPSDLDDCSDTYVLPHADPTWTDHKYLLDFNTLNNGYIWAGCHAVSVLEGIFNPADTSSRMNFLSENGLQCYSGGNCEALISEDHGNPTEPYTYDPLYGTHPIMQFMGDMTPAQDGGSEQWYIPLTTGRWNFGSSPAITTSDGAAPRKGVKLIFGRGFDKAANGLVMYEGGHSVGGSAPENVAAQRAFFNFLFLASVDKGMLITHNIPKTFVKGQPQSVAVSVTKGSPAYTYQWTATCGGTFSSPTSATTNFSVSNLYTSDKCYLLCEVTDACGRFNFVKVRINIIQANGVTSIYNGVNVSCNGASDGSIDLSTSGGTAPYTWQWSTGATTEDISGLTAGSYVVTTTDADGYVDVDTFVLAQPTVIALSNVNTNVSCFGGSNGAVDLSVSGGITPYSYAWSTGATTQDISGRSAGTYTVTVTDLNGCIKSGSSTITQPAQLTASLSIINVSTCFGNNDGSINLTASGGTSPYTYDWADIVGTNNSEDRTGLIAGTYTVTVTDSKGCTASASGTVTQPAVLSASTTQVNVACNGASTGSIDLSPTGGTTPYSYSWTNGATTQDISTLVAGTYTVTVTDTRGCTITRSAIITQPAALTTSETHVNVSCNGGSNGSIDLTVSGGTISYSYLWSSGQTTQDISGRTAGTYTVTVTDGNGCTATRSVTISQPTALSTSYTQVNVSCNAGGNGSIDLTVSGGTTAYTYAWTGGVTTQDRSGLTAGTYNVTVTDANGCTSITGTTITQPTALSTSATQVNVSCNGGSNGSIDLTVSGGTTSYSYSWSNGATTQDISGLAIGTYTVTVTDANSCTTTLSRTITQPATLTASATKVDVSCNGGSNGSIDLTPAGGTTPYTYVWSNGATTQDISTLAAGTFTVTVTDNKGCTVTNSTTITEPTVLTASNTKVDVSCNGGSNGSIDLTPAGGTTPYTYAWTNGATTQDISSLSFGSYTITVTDNKGCTVTSIATITQPSSLSASVSKTDVSCNGGSNGSVTLTVSGGTTAYSYSWSNGATTQNLSGLTAGTYNVTVTDANGCTVTTGATVTQPAVLTASTAKVDVSCNGGSNGSITLTVSGGTTAYSYSWSNGATTQNISGLTIGTYNVTVTDLKGCTVTTGTTITQPAVLVASTTQVSVSCFGASNGSVDLTVTGGTTPYSYLWSNSATTQDISGLVANPYSVTVTDAKGCTISANVTITQPSVLAASNTKVNVSCNGGNNGSIDLTVSGGTTAYTYVWSNGSSTQDLSGLSTGTYTVTVTDAQGCTTTSSATITQPSTLTASNSKVNVSCNGGSNGSIDLTVSGGTTAYSYLWSNSATTQDVSSLPAGTYTVTVTDANGCTITSSATISQPAVLTASNTHVDVNCNSGSNGSIDLSVSGGTAPFSYSWSNSATTQDISGLSIGTYTVTVTDNKGCTTSSSATITQPAVLSASTSEVDVLCNGGNNGSIDLTVSGGTTAYSYIWSNGATTQDISTLAAGTYTVTVTDFKGCTVTKSATISEPAVISFSWTTTNASCNGGADGGIDLTVTGGVVPFAFLWSNSATTEDLANIAANLYSVTVTDDNGCKMTANVPVGEATALAISLNSITHVSCNGGNNGAIDISTSGGTTPYVYAWSNGATSQDISSLTAGSYTVTVTDAVLCSKVANYIVTQPAVLTASTTQVNVSCNGGSDGSIDLTITGGTTAYNYSWSNGATTQDISGLSIGTYNVTITDAKVCTATASTTITQPTVLASSTTQVNVSCNGGSNGSIDLTVSGGTSPYAYSWSNSSVAQDISGLIIGTYNVTITDTKGCTITANVTITQPALLAASTTQVNVSCNAGSNGSIDLSPSGGTTPYSYSWSNSSTTQDISSLSIGTYNVTLTDAKGCTVTSGATITEPVVLATSATQVNVSCKNGTDGSINLTVTGGTTPYAYSWSNAATTEDINSLIAATYTVTVTDSKGCTTTLSKTITEPALLITSITSSNVSCKGGSDGSVINLAVAGGTIPYTYLWSNGATTQNISGLTAATYRVTVTDAKSCVKIDSIIITEPPLLIASRTQVNVSCNGGNNGSIDLSVNGGTASYSYNWSNGATTQDISGLTIGTYNVTVTDAKGCTVTSGATITEPSALTASATQMNVNCFGGNNGSIDLTVSGGTSPYSYLWSNSATTQDINGLIVGTYNVTVTDSKGCITTSNVTITQPAILSASNGPVVNVSCNGLSDGSINLTVTGGTTAYAFVWSNGATTEDISTLVAGTYNVTVTDAQGCTLTTGTVITEPAVLQASGSTSHVNVSCNGNSDGSINLEVTGGTSPYSYSWSNAATTEDISGLVAGTYTVTVTDAKSCSFTMSESITEPAVLAASSTQVNVSCKGGNDASIDLTVTGGTTLYTYNWSNGLTTQDINGLSAGAYDVTVTDALGCSITEVETITEPAVLTASTTQVNVSCFGGNNASIDLTIAGGTTPYTYNWSNGATTQDISSLIAGAYDVTVTDALNCSVTTSATITEPALLTSSTSHVNASCFGGNNGSIDLTVAGGTTAYSYVWSNGAITQDISGLIAGTYNVTVTDAQSCSTTASATITEPVVLAASTTQVNVSCNGGSNGSIDLTVTGGTTAYSYNWNNGASTQDISGLVAASYSVTVTDAQGCSLTTSVTITEPAVLALSTTHVDMSCNGGNDGSVDLTVTGGTTSYSYNWDNGATTQDIGSLTIGTYSVTVTDAQGCSATTFTTISEPSLLTASTIQVNVSCFGGNNGSIDLTAAGGTTPYAFSWSNGATTEDISILTIGTYTVTVTDAQNCTITSVATIIQPALLTASTAQVNVSCNGGGDGSIDLSVAGGSPSYTYIWNTGSTAQDIGGLYIGTYHVTVTDAQSCTVTTSATITEPPVLAGSETHVDVSCKGGNDGSIDITITGGTVPYTYLWSNGATSQDISGLTVGNYIVTVTDAEDCEITSTIYISEPELLTTSTAQINVSCFGGNDASINLSVQGGTAPYNYNWSNGATTQDVSSLTIGTNTVTVTDALGCSTTRSATITEPAMLTASTTKVDVTCFGFSDGSIDLTIAGGTTPYSFIWSNGQTIEDVDSLLTGTFTVTVTDAKNCTVTVITTINQPAGMSSSTTQVNVSCNGGNDGSIDLTVSGGTIPYSYLWSNGATTQDISSLSAGAFSVTITDSNACSVTNSVTITEPAVLAASKTHVDVSCNSGNNGSVDLTITGGTTPYAYSWSNGATTQDISGLVIGTYNATVSDSKGCSATSSATIIEPTLLTASATKVDVSCNGGNNGSIELTVSGGSTPYIFNWSNGATTEDLSALTIGTYIVTVTDAKNCTVTVITTITEPGVLQASYTTVSASCNGGNDGSVDLTITGGTTTYTYIWSTGAITEDLIGLAAGMYGGTITDAQGCITSLVAVVSEATAMNISLVTQTNVSCNAGSNGALDISVSGGTLPYTYAWSNGQITQDVSGLTIGNFLITVTDSNSCSKLANYSIFEPTELIASSSVTNVTCYLFSNGAINITVSGGVEPYSYIWNNGATSKDINSVVAGIYSLTITDSNGCSIANNNALTEPALLDISETHIDLVCNAGATGSIDITVSGGATPYSYLWSNGSSAQDLISLVVGSYTVTVTDANSCSLTKAITLNEPTIMVLTPITEPAMCGVADGKAIVSVSGGTPSYSYLWSTGATLDSITNLSGGVYQVTVTDANSCQKSLVIGLNAFPSANVTVTKTDVTCHAGSNGSATATVTSGTPPFTYLWAPSGSNISTVTGLSAGDHSVAVYDSVGCAVIKTVSIYEPSDFSLMLAVDEPSCNGGGDGSINLTVSGSTPSYTFNWSNGATTEDISGLSSGSYSVTIIDSKSCTSSVSATINQPNALSISKSKIDVSCNGGNNGSINLTVSGGTTPYSFNWSNGATTEDISNLTANTYSITITDAQGCSLTNSSIVAQPAAFSVTFTQQNVRCKGNANGSINISVGGGTAPYAFLWSTGATTEDVIGLIAGSYTVTVTDANSCSATKNISITEPLALTVNLAKINVSCNSGNNGSIDLTVKGGTTPYSYNWSNGAATQDISGLTIGNYIVTVLDANNCSVSQGIVISQPSILLASAIKTNVSCHGGANGLIDVVVLGGTAPYEYLWSNGATVQDISGLIIGTYSVTVTDANSCTVTSSSTITEPFALAASTTKINVSCNGGSNGSVDLNVSGGTVPYSYTWSNGATTQDISGLVAGTYNITITDAKSCTRITAATIIEPPLLTVSVTKIDASCNGGNNGSIDLTVDGGTVLYIYSWSNGATSQDISGLIIGTYNVTITDSKGCVTNSSTTITEPVALSASLAKVDASCIGSSNGSIDLTVSGGTAAYTYSWSNGATTQDIIGLISGTYNVTVTDANNCIIIKSATITQPSSLSASTTQINVSCKGGSNGSIDLTVSGGTTPYAYNWSNGATTQDISRLIAGTYNVTIVDAKSCTRTATATIIEPPLLTASLTKISVSCKGGSNGSIDLTVSGGTPPYNYNWSNGLTIQDISGLSIGNYIVTVTDSKGCIANSSAVISQPVALAVSLAKVDVNCNGSNSGSIDLTVSGGTPSYTYLWNTGATTQDVSGLVAGVYSVTVRDANGCSAMNGIAVNQPAQIAITFVKTDVSCNAGSNGAIDITVNGGTAPYRYAWSTGLATQDITGLASGSYSVTVRDANNCSTSLSMFINQTTAITATLAQQNVACNSGSSGSINLTLSGGVPPYVYLWSNGTATKDLNNINVGSYTVTVTDANGCSVTRNTSISEPSGIVVIGNIANALCNGSSTGSITLTVSGGTPSYTYLWSTGATTKNVSGLASGNFSVTVSDANSCANAKSYNITEPAQLAISVTRITDALCNGTANGTITISVSGGISPYTYLWSNGAATASVNGLAAGSYSVTVTDANSCVRSSSNNVGQPPALTVSGTSISNTLCNGSSTGSINITASGGTPGYTFRWNTGATTEDISGLAVGGYRVTVTDAQSCTAINSFNIGQPANLAVTITSSQDASCNAAANGSINVTVNGGTPPYTYSWSNGAAIKDISGLIAGTYTLTVTDANNCTKTAIQTIAQPGILTATSLGISDAKCYGQASGSINITVSGGTMPYTFIWSSGATTEDISNVSAGSYSVTITDSKFCSKTASYNIGQPSTAMTIAIAGIADVKCQGQATGLININVSGGTQPYSYLWSNGATTKNVTGLSVGSYNVTVTDANSCQKVGSFNIGEPAALVVSTTAIINAACFGQNGGSIDITVNGGTPSYTYSWSNGAVTQDIGGIPQGNYTVTVTDANSCTVIKNSGIGQSPEIAIMLADSVNISCYGGSNGAIDINVIGGTPGYTYSWSNGATSQDISAVIAGRYTLTISDSKGCIKHGTFNITQPDAVAIAVIGISDATCNGQASGSINITVTGGTSPYLFSWSNGASTENMTAVVAGSYRVTVADANGCIETQDYNIGEPAAIAVNTANINDVKCFGDTTGAIEVVASGGTAPYKYTWSTGEVTKDIINVIAGIYEITVTDLVGCKGIESYAINEPSELAIEITDITHAGCNAGNNGAITVTVLGGTPPYAYKWSNGMSISSATGLTAGTYDLTVVDANYCRDEASAEVKEATSLNVQADITDLKCFGNAKGAINIVPSGGTAPYTFSWSTGATTEDISGLTAGNYIVSVSDGNICNVVRSFTVSQPGIISDSNSIIVKPSCAEIGDGRIELSVTGGNPPYRYIWSSGVESPALIDISAGTYSVTITDVNNCTGTGEFTLEAMSCNRPPVAVNDTSNVTIGQPHDIPVMNNDYDPDDDNINLTGIIHNPAHGTATTNSDGSITYVPYQDYIGEDALTYVICDDGNPSLCDTAIVFITIKPEKPNLFIPTAISPNQDESNEYWEIKGIGLYQHNEVLIFNRWGNEVYRMNSYRNQWNGVNQHKESLPDGTYYFILKLNDKYKSIYTGYVVIFRG